MKRFFNYWKNYGLELNQEVTSYIYDRARIRTYKRGEPCLFPSSNISYWNFIISGQFLSEEIDPKQRTDLRLLQLPYETFTSTQHPFTNRESTWEYKAIVPSEVLQLKITDIVYLQKNSAVFSEILHILKQRRLIILEKVIKLSNIKDPYLRFCFFKTEFQPIVRITPHIYQRQFLAISNGSYYNYQHRLLHQR